MTERRYTEQEVAAIFEQATEAQQTSRKRLPPGEGLTLSDLQEIGRDVGIPPELIERAAKSVALPMRSASRTFLGLPIGVGRTVELDRRLSEEDWERLVVDLRETFDARGTLRYDGPFRQWTNGNLQALLEPTATGHRLRLKTLKGDARAMMAGGVAVLAGGVASLIAMVVSGGAADMGALSSMGLLSVMGLGMFGSGALRLPRWARLREAQMEAVAARLALAVEETAPKDEPAEHTDDGSPTGGSLSGS
jgi:hypothetical protein